MAARKFMVVNGRYINIPFVPMEHIHLGNSLRRQIQACAHSCFDVLRDERARCSDGQPLPPDLGAHRMPGCWMPLVVSGGVLNGYRNVKVNARVVLNTFNLIPSGKRKTNRLKHTSEWDMLVRWKVSHNYLVFEESQMYRMHILCMIKGYQRYYTYVLELTSIFPDSTNNYR